MAITALEKAIIDGVKYNTVKFGDINFGALGYVVQASPNYEFAEDETENTRIPGRNGDNIHYTGAYLNTSRIYYLVLKLEENNDFRNHSEFVRKANSIVTKLKTIKGYETLQDTFEPEYFRKAIFRSGGVVTNGRDEILSIQLEFELMPQRWLISGDAEIESGFNNPTSFDALPKIIVSAKAIEYEEANPQPTSETFEKYKYYIKNDNDEYIRSKEYIEDTTYYVGSQFESETNLTINNQETIVIKWLESMNRRTIIIDSEMQDCYDVNGNNLNALVGYLSEFPKLLPGTNTITIQNGTLESVKPRWWTL